MKIPTQLSTARTLRQFVLCLVAYTSFVQVASAERQIRAKRPSVLFLNIDDWNDWNEVLKGHPQAITPNIKRLAERGVVFSNAICSSPTCFPSRSAIFTGIHPARSGNIVNDNSIHPWRFYAQKAITLPKHLSSHGWQSVGIGKNFHNRDRGEFDEYISRNKSPRQKPGSGINLNPSGRWGVASVPTAQMPDYIAVSHGIEKLTTVNAPLFLSLGIYRPHVPWVVPQEYFDLYPLDGVQFPERRADDLDDLPERFKLLAHLEAKFGKGYNQKLAEKGYDPKMGARPMARIIQEHIKRPLAEELLFGRLEGGGHVRIVIRQLLALGIGATPRYDDQLGLG